MEDQELLGKFKTETSTGYELTEYQRRDANRDLRFIGITGGMWEDYLDATHGDDSQRAKLEFDMTTDNVMTFVGEWTENRAGVIFEPDDTDTTDDDAELLTGVYRGDFRENGGKASQDNAILEAAICGVGAVQLSEKFVDEEDPENDDQEIIWKTVHNSFDHVIFDPNAKEANKSDAKWVVKLSGHHKDAFKEKYPDLSPTSAYTPSTTYENSFVWYTDDQIYIAERYDIKIKNDEVSVWGNIESGEKKTYFKEDLEDVKQELLDLGWEHIRDRKIKRQTVEKSIFTGQDFIQKPKRIAGKYLPIVPIYAYRVFIGGREYSWGLVRKLIDGNRTINTLISKLAETSAASADDINIYLAEQVEGHENELANNTDKPYQIINTVFDDSTGQKVPMGPVGKINSPQVDQSALTAIDAITNYMAGKTQTQQDTVNPDVSGKAVNALIKRDNLKTKVISNNIVESLGQIGRVYRSKAGDLYTKPMMKKAISPDGTLRTVDLNTLAIDPQNGNPIKMHDLSRGRFSTTIDVGPQYETQREATVESIERVIEKLPETSPLLSAAFAVWIDNIEGTGLEPFKKLNRRLMIQQGLIDPETDDEKQELEQMQQQTDPNDELVKAATEQQLGEAAKLNAQAKGEEASSIKDMATAEKTKAETASIVVDINERINEGAASKTFRRFAAGTEL